MNRLVGPVFLCLGYFLQVFPAPLTLMRYIYTNNNNITKGEIIEVIIRPSVSLSNLYEILELIVLYYNLASCPGMIKIRSTSC